MTTRTEQPRHLRRVVRRTPPYHPGEPDLTAWPFTLPAVRELWEDGLEIGPGVTFLVGENGSGKSTLVEAIASRYPRQGARSTSQLSNLGPEPSPEDSQLGLHLQVERDGMASPHGYFLRAELMHSYLAQQMDERDAQRTWSGVDVMAMSHGQSFLEVLRQRFTEVGVYFLDEPESALSFQSSLGLLALFAVLASEGSQVICATHSPLLCALPGATILEVGEHGLRHVAWDDLELVRHWRAFLEAPDRYLRHLV